MSFRLQPLAVMLLASLASGCFLYSPIRHFVHCFQPISINTTETARVSATAEEIVFRYGSQWVSARFAVQNLSLSRLVVVSGELAVRDSIYTTDLDTPVAVEAQSTQEIGLHWKLDADSAGLFGDPMMKKARKADLVTHSPEVILTAKTMGNVLRINVSYTRCATME